MSIKAKTIAFVKRQRYGVLALGAVLMLGVLAGSIFMPTRPAQATTKSCPAGSYQIGWDKDDPTQPVCKMEPTGCPFGDSVPLDRCTPPPDIECNADWSECHPKTTKPTTPVTNPAQPVTTPQEPTTPVNTCVSK